MPFSKDFNSQRETYFLLNLFCLTQCPQNGCLYERCSQCEASSFKAKCPEMDAFQQRLLNSQRETYFLLKPDAPKTNAFHVKDVVNIEPFCLTQCPSSLLQTMRRSILSSLTEACTLQVHPLQIPDRQSSKQSTDEASWIHID